MAITIFSDVFTLIDTAIINVVSSKTANLMNVLSPVFLAGFIVYVIFVTWSYFGSSIEQTLWDLLKRITAWGVIISFSINVGSYLSNVVPLVTGLGDGLTQIFSGSTGTIDSSLDSLATTFVQGIWDTFDKASGVEGTLLAISAIAIIVLFGVPFFVIAAAYILLAKVFAAILAVVGPVFIACALFPATRQYFSSWVNQVVNYALLLLLLNITATIFIEFIRVQFGTGVFDLARSINLAFAAGMFFIVLLKIPELASGLSQGMAINGFAQAGRAVMAASKAGALMKGAGAAKGAGGGGGGGAIKAEGKGK